MRTRPPAATVALAAFAATILASCVSIGPTALPRGEIGPPGTHTLVYGYLGFHNVLGKRPMQYARYVQLDPGKEAGLEYAIHPRYDGSFFLPPLPTGTSWKLLSFQDAGTNSTTIYQQGVMGKDAHDPRIVKPGLMYLGAFAWSAGPRAWAGEPDYAAWGIYPFPDEGYELSALEALLPQFAKTEWEAIIRARIKELEK